MSAGISRRGFLRFAVAAACVRALPGWAWAGAEFAEQTPGMPPDAAGPRAWRPYDPYEHLWRYVSAAESKDMNPLVKESGQS